MAKVRTAGLFGWLVCIVGALFYCFEYLLRLEPSLITSDLRMTYHVNAAVFATISAMYYVAYTPTQLIVGVITDRFGPRKVLTVALLFCVVGSFLFAYTANIFMAGASRLVIGFGSAFAFVGVLKLAAIWLPKKRFTLFAGIATGLSMVGAMAGDIELSLLIHHVGWRPALYYVSSFGLILLPLIWLMLKSHKPRSAARSRTSLRQAIQGLRRIVKDRHIWFAGTVGCLMYMSLSVFAVQWGADFIAANYGYSQVIAPRINSAVFLGWLIGAPLMGFLSDHLDKQARLMMICSLVAGIIFSVVLYAHDLSVVVLYVLLFLFGLFCSGQVSCFTIGRKRYSVALTATVIAFINMVVMLGGMILQPAVGYILDFFWQGGMHDKLRIYSAAEYRLALSIIPIGLLVAMVMAFFIDDREAKS